MSRTRLSTQVNPPEIAALNTRILQVIETPFVVDAPVATDQVCWTRTTTAISSLSPTYIPYCHLHPSCMATATTTTNTQFLPPTAPVVTAVALDENAPVGTESPSTHLGRSPTRSALTVMWEAVDEIDKVDNEYASLVRSESEGASGAFPTFPVSSLLSTIRITSCDELTF